MPIAKSGTQSAHQPSDLVQLAVIGGGPKAAAIAAKAWALRERGQADIRVTIFEPETIGAYWSGKAGYTDGKQRLCTIAERDVGYPYNSMFGRDVDITMASTFSWARFLQTRPAGYETGYSTWVDAGRKPPSHKHFADYLQWVVSETSPQAKVEKQRVTRLTKERKRWQIGFLDGAGNQSTYPIGFDAAIVTGPGPAKRVTMRNASGASSEKIFDGRNFWQRSNDVLRCLKQAAKDSKYSENAIVIIGAGGTAAAIFAWLVANGAADLPIQMVASQAALYTRVDSVFENQLFSDETQWSTLSSKSRRAFFDRLNRGVVWATIMDRVSSASKFKMVDGRAKEIIVSSPADVELEVLRGDGETVTLQASMLIDCSGFDAWWFLSLIDGFPAVGAEKDRVRRERWQDRMRENLQLHGTPWDVFPALHAPMLSSKLGPGFGSLMVLGAMADRVLRTYR